jgi:hypothetical protein
MTNGWALNHHNITKVKAMWAEFRSAVESAPDATSKQKVAVQNLPLLKEMNAAVQMFAKL